MKKSPQAERRKHRRFHPSQRAFVLVGARNDTLKRIDKMSNGEIGVAVFKSRPARMGRLLDISRNGLTYSYIPETCKDGDGCSRSMDILIAEERFLLSKVPFTPIKDVDHEPKNAFQPVGTRRQTVRFENLTPQQRAQLDYLLENWADPKTTAGTRKQVQGNG